MLAWNNASTSAGVISSSSAAVQSLRGIEDRLSLGDFLDDLLDGTGGG
jgi:hypothetical protein